MCVSSVSCFIVKCAQCRLPESVHINSVQLCTPKVVPPDCNQLCKSPFASQCILTISQRTAESNFAAVKCRIKGTREAALNQTVLHWDDLQCMLHCDPQWPLHRLYTLHTAWHSSIANKRCTNTIKNMFACKMHLVGFNPISSFPYFSIRNRLIENIKGLQQRSFSLSPYFKLGNLERIQSTVKPFPYFFSMSRLAECKLLNAHLCTVGLHIEDMWRYEIWLWWCGGQWYVWWH